MSSGSLFLSHGPAVKNDWSSTVVSCEGQMTKSLKVDDQSRLL